MAAPTQAQLDQVAAEVAKIERYKDAPISKFFMLSSEADCEELLSLHDYRYLGMDRGEAVHIKGRWDKREYTVDGKLALRRQKSDIMTDGKHTGIRVTNTIFDKDGAALFVKVEDTAHSGLEIKDIHIARRKYRVKNLYHLADGLGLGALVKALLTEFATEEKLYTDTNDEALKTKITARAAVQDATGATLMADSSVIAGQKFHETINHMLYG